MNTANIRSALRSDKDRLITIDELAEVDSARRNEIIIAVDNKLCWLLEVDETVIGYGVLQHHFFAHTFIELVYIEPAFQSCGYGPQLIQYLEGESLSPSIFTSTNESNNHMQTVLGKMGYEPAGVIHALDPDDPELIFVKCLVSFKNK